MTYHHFPRSAAPRARAAVLAALLALGALVLAAGVAKGVPGHGEPAASVAVSTPGTIGDADPLPLRTGKAPGGQPPIRGDHASPADHGGRVGDSVSVFDGRTAAVAKLDLALLGALRRAATDASSQGVELEVNSGWRSAAYQEELLSAAVEEYGSAQEAARWVATPQTSAHVLGEAVDIGPSSAATWLSQHGAGYGLCQIYGNEPWHYELRPEAADRGCPAMYPDPTHDPRMQR